MAKPLCKLCKDTGYIWHNRTENGQTYQYVCLCICKSAEGKEYNGMTIEDKAHRQPFYVATAQEVFGDKIFDEQK